MFLFSRAREGGEWGVGLSLACPATRGQLSDACLMPRERKKKIRGGGKQGRNRNLTTARTRKGKE